MVTDRFTLWWLLLQAQLSPSCGTSALKQAKVNVINNVSIKAKIKILCKMKCIYAPQTSVELNQGLWALLHHSTIYLKLHRHVFRLDWKKIIRGWSVALFYLRPTIGNYNINYICFSDSFLQGLGDLLSDSRDFALRTICALADSSINCSLT